MELCSIASGSSGNCIYAGADHCHVLVDAGISGKRIEAGLNEIGLKTAEMDGILVTHEHSDQYQKPWGSGTEIRASHVCHPGNY